MSARQVLDELRSLSDPSQLEGMARFGIATGQALGGINLPTMRALARRIGTDHGLAQRLWASGIHEARIVAGYVDDPGQVTAEQMEEWAADFDSWDIVDNTCGDLFDRTPFAYQKAVEWAGRDEEFVKRAGFALIARLAVHDKATPDRVFGAFLPIIEREAADSRNFVRKAVNWALREIGKRSSMLNGLAIGSAERILSEGPRPARWVASDALRELRSDSVRSRLAEREARQGRARIRVPRPRPAAPS
jgi:3-methyladenine DNA glycosylase AlkD